MSIKTVARSNSAQLSKAAIFVFVMALVLLQASVVFAAEVHVVYDENGGSVTPPFIYGDAVVVTDGESQLFRFTTKNAPIRYKVTKVEKDYGLGGALEEVPPADYADDTYTWLNMTGDGNVLFVTFEEDTTTYYNITVICGANGSVYYRGDLILSGSDVEVASGTDVVFNFMPDVDYVMNSVYWDGVAEVPTPRDLEKSNIVEDHDLSVSFVRLAKWYLETSIFPDLVGAGWITIEPDQIEYDDGSWVELTYDTNPDFKFNQWGGDASGTAHTYAQSRGCQEQMKDRAEGRLNAVSAEIKTVRAVGDHYLEGILARIEKKLSGATD